MTRDDIAQDDEEMLFWDHCDDALIGRAERCGQPPLAAYGYDQLVAVFTAGGMSHDEAVEFIGEEQAK